MPAERLVLRFGRTLEGVTRLSERVVRGRPRRLNRGYVPKSRRRDLYKTQRPHLPSGECARFFCNRPRGQALSDYSARGPFRPFAAAQ